MKNTGITKKIDNLGRIVIPNEILKTLNLKKQDTLEFFTEGECLILKRYTKDCFFCGTTQNLLEFKGKCICKSCIDKLKEMA